MKKKRVFIRSTYIALLLAALLVFEPLTVKKVSAADVEFGSNIVEVDENGRVIIPLTISPVTSSFQGTLEITLFFLDKSGNLVEKKELVMKDVTAEAVYDDAYKIDTKAVVYEVPERFGSGTQFQLSPGTVTVRDVVYMVVYLNEYTPPEPTPKPSPTPVVPGPITSVGTDTGWISVNLTSGECTCYVDPELVAESLASAGAEGALILDMTKVQDITGKAPENVVANVPIKVLDQALSLGTAKIRMDTGLVEIAAPPEVLHTDEVEAAGQMATLRVKVVTVTSEETQSYLSELSQEEVEGLKAASNFYKISLSVVPTVGSEKPITKFGGKTSFAFRYDPGQVVNPRHLNVYEKGSLKYVGGKVDIENNRVIAQLSEFKTGEFIVMEHSKKFQDVPDDYWGKEDIELMASKYVVNGMTDTTFEPESNTTRAQFVTMLVRSLGILEEKPSEPTFTDVGPSDWYYGYVEAGFKAGLVNGDSGPGGTFRPNDYVTREEMAALMVRAMSAYGNPAKDITIEEASSILEAFSDSQDVSDWAKVEVAQAIAEGLIKGREEANIAPTSNAKRAEAATVMSRFMTIVGII